MPDQNVETNDVKKPKQGFVQKNAENIRESIENGSAVFLSGEETDGQIKIYPQPCISLGSGRSFHGANQIIAQQAVKQQNIQTNKFAEYNDIKAAGTFVYKNSPHFVLTTYNRESNTQNKYWYYPITHIVDKNKYDLHIAQKKDPNATEPLPEKKQQDNRNLIFDARGITDSEKYLGQYLAATSVAGTFITDKNTVTSIQQNLKQKLNKDFDELKFASIFTLGNNASKNCIEVLKSTFEQKREKENPIPQKEQVKEL